ncbi:hypothetical protein HDU98_002257 [Podochytrium sp. JEL0797]|nr:hypothetical protein HDU98_002257 [Podochytrium sp. JEL0797]
MTGVSSIGLLAFVSFVTNPRAAGKTATSFNASLLVFSISILFVHLLEAILLESTDPVLYELLGTLQNLLLAVIEICYVSYSWKRGSPIVHRIYPTAHTHLERLIKAFPAIALLANMPQCVLVARNLIVAKQSETLTLVLETVENALISVSGMIVLVLDVFLLVSFIKFTRSTIQDTQVKMDPRLAIIARYGMCASTIWLLGVVDGVLYSLGIPDSTLFGLLVFMIANLAFFLLFALKIALYFEEKRSLASATSMSPSTHQSKVITAYNGGKISSKMNNGTSTTLAISDGSISVHDAILLSYTMAGVSSFGLVTFLSFVVFWDSYKLDAGAQKTDQATRSWKNVATSFNASLLLFAISLLFANLLQAFLLETTNPVLFELFGTLANLLVSVIEICYVSYSWKRGSPIVKRVYPTAHKYLEKVMMVFPAIAILSNVPECVVVARAFLVEQQDKTLTFVLYSVENSLITITACIVLVMDVFLLTSFIKFIHTTIRDTQVEMDPRLAIVARYGIVASIIWMVGVADGVLFSLNMPGSFLMGLLVYMIADLEFFVLFALKIALYFDEQRSLAIATKTRISTYPSKQ